jgi:hypothetical protein
VAEQIACRELQEQFQRQVRAPLLAVLFIGGNLYSLERSASTGRMR